MNEVSFNMEFTTTIFSCQGEKLKKDKKMVLLDF